MIRPFPIQGEQYVTKNGDTLRDIAARAYGDQTKHIIILRSNNFKIKFSDGNSVAAGETINIPRITY